MADPYENPAGEPALADSFAVFVDALGTRAAAAGLTDGKLRELIARRKKYLFMLDGAGLEDVQRTLTFTDNVVVGHADPSNIGFLRTCFNAAAYQLGATLVGESQRGGIAFGPMYVGDDIAHGQALMDASDLEHTVARHPRIVLSAGLRRRLKAVSSEAIAKNVSADVVTRMFVRDDGDGEVFLDYLRVMGSFSSIAEFNYTDLGEVIQQHKTVVVEQLDRHLSREVRQKYVWLADYHNWAVATLEVGPAIDMDFRRDSDPDEHKFAVGWVS